MPGSTPFRCPEFSWRKKSTSGRWGRQHIKLKHPEHLRVARQKYLTIRSAPLRVEPTKRREFNTNKDSVEELDEFPYLEHIENIADS